MEGKEVVEEVTLAKVEKDVTAAGEAKEEVAGTPEFADQPAEETVSEESEEISLDHPEDGHRVHLEHLSSFFQTVAEGRAKQQLQEAQEAAAKATEYNESYDTTAAPDPRTALDSATQALLELRSQIATESSQTLQVAHAALRSDLDQEYFQDLEDLSEKELRVRVVQLATEMSDRTKWEAVRLKEFLAMKEKEVGEK